jgi:tight adherence protein C
VIAGLGLGAGLGVGVFLLGRAIVVSRVPLAVALADLDRPRMVPLEREQRGAQAVELLEGLGIDFGRVRGDLRVTGRTPERHAVEKLAAAGVGLGTPLVVALAASAGGADIPVGVAVTAALVFGVGGFFLPDVLLRDAAKARRDAFRHALSAYLDLVNVLLAGSAGTETALVAAAEAGDGWAFAEIRATLARAEVTRRSPWDAFAALGAELGVSELQELAASVRLASEQGARIKSSLAAKAAALRGQQLARAEASAQAASERMAVPNVLMFLGFLAFAGYPALVSIIGGI